MIVDKINNINIYKCLGDRFAQAIKFAENNQLLDFDNGKYSVDGENVFVIVQEYETKPLLDGKAEAHQKYIDIQIILKGEENIGYEILHNQQPTMPYNPEREVAFFNSCKSYIKLSEGEFAIFYPWDIHMPGLRSGEGSTKIKKAVFKILYE